MSRASGGALLTRAGALALLALMAAGAAFVKARSWDLWWHIETGEQILRRWAVPRADDFSFTSQGTPWVDHEWLFQIALYLAHAAAGPAGLFVLKAASALAVAWIGYAAMRRGDAPPSAALCVVALALIGMRFRLAERPEIATLALAPAAGALLVDLSLRPFSAALRLGGLAALALGWVNLHAGALLAPIMAAACAAGAVADRALAAGGRRRLASGAIVSMTAALLVTGLFLLGSPYGHRVWMVPLGIATALDAPNLINPEWQPPAPAGFPLFYIAAAVMAVCGGLALWRRRPGAGTRAALVVLAIGMAVTSIRHIGIFFAMIPVLLDPAVLPLRLTGSRASGPLAASLCVAVAVGMAMLPPEGGRSGIGIQEKRFPEEASRFIETHLPDARVYNDVAFGGYLIWRGYPQRRVFIDGRNEVHAALLRELSGAIDDSRRWADLLARHQVDAALVSYRPDPVRVRDGVTGALSTSTFSEVHFPSPGWALVHWDDVAMLFVRRQGRYAPIARQHEYPHARPEFWRQSLDKHGIVSVDNGAVSDIRRKLSENPACELAAAVATVYGVQGRSPAP